MAKTEKTHAMRVLDAKGIAYSATVYDASGTFHSGEDAAAIVGALPDGVYKTLVVLREASPRARPLMVMVASNAQVDLKLLAAAIGEKKLRMATQREAEQLTGMQVGGISALALHRPTFDILLDEAARSLDRIHVSAGARGVDIELRVEDLVMVTNARFVRATT